LQEYEYRLFRGGGGDIELHYIQVLKIKFQSDACYEMSTHVIVLINYHRDTGYLDKIYCREVMMMMMMMMMMTIIASNIYFQAQRMQFVTPLPFEVTAILGESCTGYTACPCWI
jgi:hypothetical protein